MNNKYSDFDLEPRYMVPVGAAIFLSALLGFFLTVYYPILVVQKSTIAGYIPAINAFSLSALLLLSFSLTAGTLTLLIMVPVESFVKNRLIHNKDSKKALKYTIQEVSKKTLKCIGYVLVFIASYIVSMWLLGKFFINSEFISITPMMEFMLTLCMAVTLVMMAIPKKIYSPLK